MTDEPSWLTSWAVQHLAPIIDRLVANEREENARLREALYRIAVGDYEIRRWWKSSPATGDRHLVEERVPGRWARIAIGVLAPGHITQEEER